MSRRERPDGVRWGAAHRQYRFTACVRVHLGRGVLWCMSVCFLDDEKRVGGPLSVPVRLRYGTHPSRVSCLPCPCTCTFACWLLHARSHRVDTGTPPPPHPPSARRGVASPLAPARRPCGAWAGRKRVGCRWAGGVSGGAGVRAGRARGGGEAAPRGTSARPQATARRPGHTGASEAIYAHATCVDLRYVRYTHCSVRRGGCLSLSRSY
jgi:hypothetical protein